MFFFTQCSKFSRILEKIKEKKVYIVYNNENNCVATFTLETKIPTVQKGSEDLKSDSIYLSKLAVSPSYSNAGIGTECIKFIEQYAKRNNYKYIKFDVYSKSNNTLIFYLKKGFEITGMSKTRRFDVVLMQKEVQYIHEKKSFNFRCRIITKLRN